MEFMYVCTHIHIVGRLAGSDDTLIYLMSQKHRTVDTSYSAAQIHYSLPSFFGETIDLEYFKES